MQRKFGENAYWVYELLRYAANILLVTTLEVSQSVCHSKGN
jgi:hypothetical protein